MKLVKGCHKRTGLTKTVLVISISVCTNSTVSIGTLQGLQENIWLIQNFLLTVFVLSGLHFTGFELGWARKCLVYPEFLVVSTVVHWF